MNFKSMAQLAGMMCVALFATTSAQAVTLAPISDLYNTGMSTPWDAAQAPLPGSDPGVAVDPHWTVAYDPPGATPVGAPTSTRTIDDASAVFAGNEFNRHQRDLASDTTAQTNGYTQLNDSQWIMPNIPGTNSPGGVYVFTTTFTTNQLSTTIAISGFFKATDVLGVQLNGGPVVDPGSPHGAASEHSPSRPPRPFSITGTGGLVNTLTFYVNRPGPSVAGFRAQFTSATFTVPEPSTICLSVLGLVGFGAARLRRRFSGKSK